MGSSAAPEQLLLQFGLDLTPIKTAGADIQSILLKLNELAKQVSDQTTAQAKQQAAAMQAVKEAANAAVQVAKLHTEQEKEKSAVLKTQTEELKKQASEHRVNAEASKAALAVENAKRAELQAQTAAIQQQIQARRLETAEIQKQITELRQRRLEEAGEAKGRAGGLAGLVSMIPGVGKIAAGVIGGEVGFEFLKEIIEKLKEITREAGSINLLDNQFKMLAKGSGVDADKMIASMADHTEGLISRFQMLQVSTAALKSKFLTPEEVSQYMGAVVRVAESQGKSAEAAMNAFYQALLSGRGQGLARQVGVPMSFGQLQNLPSDLSMAQRQEAQFKTNMRLIQDYSNQLGELPLTFEQMEKRLAVSFKDLSLALGQGLNKSAGAQVFMGIINDGSKTLESLYPKIVEFGKKLGDAFAVAAVTAQALFGIVKSLGAVVKDLADVGGDLLFGGKLNLASQGDEAAKSFAKLHPILNEIVLVILQMGMEVRVLLAYLDAFLDKVHSVTDTSTQNKLMMLGGAIGLRYGGVVGAAAGMAVGGAAGLAAGPSAGDLAKQRTHGLKGEVGAKEVAKKSLDEQLKAIEEEATAQYKQFSDNYAKAQEEIDKETTGISGPKKPGTVEKLAEVRRLNAAILQEQLSLAKLISDSHKATLDEAKRQDDEYYKNAKETLEAHVQAQLIIAAAARRTQQEMLTADFEARLSKAQADFEAKKKQYTNIGEPVPKREREIYGLQVQQYSQQYADQMIAADRKFNTERLTLFQQVEDDKRQAAIKNIQDEANAEKEALAFQEKGLQRGLAQRNIDPETYYSKRIELIRNSALMEISYNQQIYDREVENEKSLADLNDKNRKVEQTAQEQIDDMMFERAKKRVDFTMQGLSYAESRAKMRGEIGTAGGDVAAQAAAISDQISIQQRRRSAAEAAMPGAIGDSSLWNQLQQDAGQAALELINLGKALDSLKDEAKTASQIGEALGTGVQQVFRSKFMQNLGAEFQMGSTEIGQAHRRGLAIGGYSMGLDTEGNPVMQKQKLSIDTFTTGVVNAAQALVGFVDSITNAKSTISGGIGGGMAGAGFGQTVSTAFGMSGPAGMLAGAGIGIISGLITGSKNAQIQRNITQLNETFKTVMQSFAENADNLQQTITQLEGLIGEARAMQASSKKGSSQYQQAIDQYVQQIMSLQAQQHNILVNLQEMLSIVQAPVGAQDFLSSLQSILKQYQQFEGAAQTTNDLAKANQFLVSSLQNYTVQMQTDYAQANAQAIQDAISLNDLLYQRVQLQIQFNSQISGIMEQGVLTRTMTFAQTKGSQIYLAQQDYQRQMQNLNEQINVTNYKVQAEQQIFSLATTRVGLEQQLAQVQIQQAQFDLQRIYALAALLQALQGGQWSSGLLGQLLAGLPSVTNTAVNLPSLGTTLGGAAATMPTIDTTALDAAISAAYQDRASAGYAAFRASNL